MRFVKKVLALVLVMGIVFISMPNLYADDTSELILKLLIKKGIITQKEVSELRAEVAKTEKAVPKTTKERLVKLEKDAPFHVKVGEGDLKLSGYMQARYTNYEDRDTYDRFTISNAKLTLKGHVVPEIAYKLEIGPHKSTSILYDAWMRLDYIDFARFTFGQFKTGLGYEYLTSSSKIDTINRSSVITNLTAEYDVGIMIDADLFDKSAYYAFEIVNGSPGTGGNRNPTSFKKTPDLISRFVFRPFRWMKMEDRYGKLDLGLGYQVGKQESTNTIEKWRHRLALLGKYELNNWKLQSEYIYQASERKSPAKDLESYGFYALTTYKIPFPLYTLKTTIEPVLKIDLYDPDKFRGKDLTWTVTPGLNWHFNKYFKIMANYQIDIDAPKDRADNRFLVQTQVKF